MPDLVEVIVGRVGRPHGLRGEVSIEVRTDEPNDRFFPGVELRTEDGRRRLVVTSCRWHQGRLLLAFSDALDRTAAEGLRGIVLVTDVPADGRPSDAEEYYDRQLRGLLVLDSGGVEVGRVSDVIHLPGQDLLAIETPDGERLVPFVAALVPSVDLAAGTCTLAADAPGLLDDLEALE